MLRPPVLAVCGLTLFAFSACTRAASTPSALRIAEQPSHQSQATKQRPDRFATLAVERELELPAEVRSIDGFIGDGSRWWARDLHSAWLFGLERDVPERIVSSGDVALAGYLDDSISLRHSLDDVVAHDTLSGAFRFRTPIAPPPRAEKLSGIGVTGSGMLQAVRVTSSEIFAQLAFAGGGIVEVVALDRATGALLWRAEATYTWPAQLCVGGGRVVAVSPGRGFTAYSARSGELGWSLPIASRSTTSPLARCSDDWVALSGVTPNSLTLVETATGTIRGSFPLEGKVVDGTFSGDLLFVEIAPEEPITSVRLLAIDTTRLAPSWISESIATDRVPELRAVGAHALIASHDFVRLYEPEHGRVVWHWGVDDARPVAFAERAGTPRLAFATNQRVTIFEASGTKPPVEQVTVHGTVTYDGAPAAGVSVIAYGTATRTDATGHYSISVEARGSLRVVALTAHQADAVLALDGRGTYELELHAEAPMP